MSVALVSVSANAGLTIAIVTKSVGAYTQKHVYAVSLTSRLDSAGESVVAEVPCVEVLEVIASIKNGDDDQGQVMIPLGNGEFSAPAMSAAHYQVHEDSFGVEQIFLADDRDISYNISCETSMAACETNPFLLCDVLPSAVTSSGRRALHAFEDAFDGEPTLQRHLLSYPFASVGKSNQWYSNWNRFGPKQSPQTGSYECHQYDGTVNKNDWHYVSIIQTGTTYGSQLIWSNRARVSWTLTQRADGDYDVGEECPYYKSGHTVCKVVRNAAGSVTSLLGPWGEAYDWTPCLGRCGVQGGYLMG